LHCWAIVRREDIRRISRPNRHLGFGGGPHYCQADAVQLRRARLTRAQAQAQARVPHRQAALALQDVRYR
jgi:cytochrome P450